MDEDALEVLHALSKLKSDADSANNQKRHDEARRIELERSVVSSKKANCLLVSQTTALLRRIENEHSREREAVVKTKMVRCHARIGGTICTHT